MKSPLASTADAVVLELPGLEADNLLAFLALLGLLRALRDGEAWLASACILGRARLGLRACILLRRGRERSGKGRSTWCRVAKRQV